ncbi:TPA: type II toxin-antitoxin system VapC family toxin [bacterium]|nr:type II toxin-antitoxin system VapC family toxin [bacterium]
MRYLLDTNVCIRYLNGQSDKIRQKLSIKNPEEIVLCSVVKAELIYGVLKSGNPAKNLQRLSSFIEPFTSLPFDDKSARVYGQIRSKLEKLGTPIGPNDLMIASIAISNNIALVTHNIDEFERVDNLYIEDWES